MKDRPIIFSARMVLKLLAGEKTQTRRLAWKDGKPTEWLKLWRDWHYRPIPAHPDYVAGRDGEIYRVVAPFEYRQVKRSTASKYPSLSLSTDGQVTTYNVHRLVCEAWYGPPPTDRHEVRHIDSSRDNCRPDNLDWAFPEGNWTDRAALGNGMGERHHAAKLTAAQAAEIRSSLLSQRTLASKYGVAQSTIWAVKNGETWGEPTEPAPISERPMGPKLWVRENLYRGATHSAWCYAADQKLICLDAGDQRVAMMVGWAHHYDHEKAPAIHMCRWASRLTLVVTEVRQQRLQEISDADCLAEGCRWQSCDHPDCQPQGHDAPRGAFYEVWRDLHGHASWAADPEVVALTFTVHQRNIDEAA